MNIRPALFDCLASFIVSVYPVASTKSREQGVKKVSDRSNTSPSCQQLSPNGVVRVFPCSSLFVRRSIKVQMMLKRPWFVSRMITCRLRSNCQLATRLDISGEVKVAVQIANLHPNFLSRYIAMVQGVVWK